VKNSMKTIILSAGVLLAACGQGKSAAEPQQRGRFVITPETLKLFI
jgi:hypothetical protein